MSVITFNTIIYRTNGSDQFSEGLIAEYKGSDEYTVFNKEGNIVDDIGDDTEFEDNGHLGDSSIYHLLIDNVNNTTKDTTDIEKLFLNNITDTIFIDPTNFW